MAQAAGAGGSRSSRYFVGIIDGTGPASQDFAGMCAYDHAMGKGFCRQLESQFGQYCVYRRGPSASGAGLDDAVGEVVKQAEILRDRDIVLIGYSRGALGCVIAAQRLKDRGVDIHAMVLFDPVDRYGASSPYKSVPNNVKASFRAYRTLSARLVLKYEGTMGSAPSGWPGWTKTIIDAIAPSNPIRPSFSSTNLGVERGGAYDASIRDQHVTKSYVGSHGAMGGVGYHWVEEDEDCQRRLTGDVSQWLSDRLDKTLVLEAGWDPDLTQPRFAGVARALVAAGAAPFDLRLLEAARLDSLIYGAKESLRNLIWR